MAPDRDPEAEPAHGCKGHGQAHDRREGPDHRDHHVTAVHGCSSFVILIFGCAPIGAVPEPRKHGHRRPPEAGPRHSGRVSAISAWRPAMRPADPVVALDPALELRRASTQATCSGVQAAIWSKCQKPSSLSKASSLGPTPEIFLRSSAACPGTGGGERSGSASATPAAGGLIGLGCGLAGLGRGPGGGFGRDAVGGWRRAGVRPVPRSPPDCLPHGASSGTSVPSIRLIVSPISVAPACGGVERIAPRLVILERGQAALGLGGVAPVLRARRGHAARGHLVDDARQFRAVRSS
jgi:hypothetical protein